MCVYMYMHIIYIKNQHALVWRYQHILDWGYYQILTQKKSVKKIQKYIYLLPVLYAQLFLSKWANTSQLYTADIH